MRGFLERHDALRWALRSRLWRGWLVIAVPAAVMFYVTGPAWLGGALFMVAIGFSVGYGAGRRDEDEFQQRLGLEHMEREFEQLLAAMPDEVPDEVRAAAQRARQEIADELRRIGL